MTAMFMPHSCGWGPFAEVKARAAVCFAAIPAYNSERAFLRGKKRVAGLSA
jgi:hypothetical protein